jgi:hypothetical protein
MRQVFFILVLGLGSMAWGTTYYVSSSFGNDSNSGTSASTAWRTLNKVNTSTLLPGDSILFNRGDVWNESLIPPSSGTSGSPIYFDAYGTGAPPTFTAAIGSLPGTGWTTITSSVQKFDLSSYVAAAPSITSPTVNYVKFGNLYGRKQPLGGGCSTTIVSKYDWCLSWPNLYVYSTNSNPVTYYGLDTPIAPLFSQSAGLSLININGRTWLTFQHIKLQNFDYMGVNVVGAADNLVFANMESDGMVPAGTMPLGFYINATNPTNIQLVNDEGLFGGKSGSEKKDAAMSFLESALSTIDAVAEREIVNPEKFKDGISKIIDGTVECLNASTWAKGGGGQAPTAIPQP